MNVAEHCCGADKLFDYKVAEKDLRSYKRKGPKRVSSRLIALLSSRKVRNKSLLDIGGGIGAVQWSFLENGGANCIDVDASSAYLEKAKKYSNEKGWGNQTDFIEANITDVIDSLGEFNFVCLDKVICCYPDYKDLLYKVTDHCSESIVLSYPMNGFFADLFRYLGVFYMKLKNNPFRPYIHNPTHVEDLIVSKGFVKEKSSFSFPWFVQLYTKVPA